MNFTESEEGDIHHQHRERGEGVQQGAEDWHDAQEGNVRISPQTYYHSYFDFVICHQVLKICIKHF